RPLLLFFLSMCVVLQAYSPSPSSFVVDPPAPEIYTLSLHDALPISEAVVRDISSKKNETDWMLDKRLKALRIFDKKSIPERSERSEEHTSELQSRFDLVCRLLLEKKKKKQIINT